MCSKLMHWTSGDYDRSSLIWRHNFVKNADVCHTSEQPPLSSTVNSRLTPWVRDSYGWRGKCKPNTQQPLQSSEEDLSALVGKHTIAGSRISPITRPPSTWGCLEVKKWDSESCLEVAGFARRHTLLAVHVDIGLGWDVLATKLHLFTTFFNMNFKPDVPWNFTTAMLLAG